MTLTRIVWISCFGFFLHIFFAGCECSPKPTQEEASLEKKITENIEEFEDSGLNESQEPSKEATEGVAEKTPEQSLSSVDDVCTWIGQTLCKPIFSCCGDKGLSFRDQAECVESFRQSCFGQKKTELEDAFREGTLRIDTKSLQSCTQGLEEAGKRCSSPSGDVQRRFCAGIFQAVANVGETCKDTLDGLFCAQGEGQCFPTPTGTPCLRWSKDGEFCKDGPCAPGLFCFLGKDPAVCHAPFAKDQPCTASAQCQAGLTCLQQKCVPQLPLGASCNAVAQCQETAACEPTSRVCVGRVEKGKPCTFEEHCQKDLFCYGTSHTGLICKVAKKENEPCTSSKDCSKDLFCTNNQCARLPEQGKTCDPLLAIGCIEPFVCDKDTKTCVALPQKDQPCLSGQTPCATGLACFTTPQGPRCQSKSAQGQPCEDDLSCQLGLACGQEKKCIPLPTDGQPCHNDYLCGAGLFCDLQSKKCATTRTIGQPCEIGHECSSGLTCLIDPQKKKYCVALPKQGEACQLQCEGALVCRPGAGQGVCVSLLCKGLISL